MNDAAPENTAQNAVMLRISEDSLPVGLRPRPFNGRPRMVAACLIDEPFRVEAGEYYNEAFHAGDYLVFTDGGLIGMAAERFAEQYEPAGRDYLGKYDAYADATGIHLEPIE